MDSADDNKKKTKTNAKHFILPDGLVTLITDASYLSTLDSKYVPSQILTEESTAQRPFLSLDATPIVLLACFIIAFLKWNNSHSILNPL